MHHKRKRARVHQGRGSYDKRRYEKLPSHIAKWVWLYQWPEYWDILYHRRPNRRLTKALERAARFDVHDADCVVWPLGNHRPHKYYW
jgi:hypothetical protein